MNNLLWFAIALLVLWVVVRLVLAVTGLVLHLVWIAALLLLAVWAFKRFVR